MTTELKKLLEGRDYYYEGPYQVMTEEFLLSRGYCCGSGCRHCPYSSQKLSPRVVSLVPSWTETLIAAGANVVGCTRFCIHPKDSTSKIKKLGGTKTVDIEKLNSLKADFIIMDKEENTKEVSELCEAKILPSHVKSLEDLRSDLLSFSKTLGLKTLKTYSERVSKVLEISPEHPGEFILKNSGIDWWVKPEKINSDMKVIYVIWKNPWMCVSKNTYIGSVFKLFGFNLYSPEVESLYPKIDLKDLDEKSIILFSSEPFPFGKEKQKIMNEFSNHYVGLIDGEAFSWFGLRSLRFIEDSLFS